MPVPLPARVKFTAEELRDESTRPIEARPWMIEHLYKPVDGFKVWRRGPKLCEAHAEMVGLIKPRRRLCYVAPHKDCDGLEGHKIVCVAIDVTRQEGKSTAMAALSLTDLALGVNIPALYMAAAEDQAKRVFEQKWVSMIRKNPRLDAEKGGVLEVAGESISNAKRNNSFVFISTSAKSGVGGSMRRIYIDEARAIEDETFFEIIVSASAQMGLECPRGHVTLPMPAEGPPMDDQVLPPCPVCGVELDEWYGVIVVASSAGEDAAWFTQLVEYLRENPDPAFHVFSSAARLNRNKSTEFTGALRRVFVNIPGLEPIVRRSLDNVPGQKGDQFLPKEAVTAIVSKKLRNVETWPGPCVAFLDCSRSTDLTSLVVCADVPVELLDDRGKKVQAPAFSKIVAVRIDVFDPKDPKQFPGGRVRYFPRRGEIEGGTIQEHLEEFIPRFPGLLELWIDVTLLSEAQDLYEWARKQPWGSKARDYHGNELESQLMWDALEMRVLSGPAGLEIPELPRLVKELKDAKTARTINHKIKVMDPKGGGSKRRLRHRDISMSLAGCCWRAGILLSKGIDDGGRFVQRLNESIKLGSRFKPITGRVLKERY